VEEICKWEREECSYWSQFFGDHRMNRKRHFL